MKTGTNMNKFILVTAYVATIPVANYLIGNVGTVCTAEGPCLIPVLPGLMAPSGVLMAGSALLFRDLVQRHFGAWISLYCIAVGAALSFLVSNPYVAFASTVAFLVSELADFAIYTPLARRWFVFALLLSCTVGAVIDSTLFLWLAFGNIEHIAGQVVGKTYAVLLYVTARQILNRKATSR